ncbi:MAG: hypothetical protein IJ507_07790 [Clostridia bacterium]|nr:hypothetical protein [Clostridia bacterium]
MRFPDFTRRDWLLAGALLLCVLICLLAPQGSSSSMTGEEKRLSEVLSAMAGAGEVEAAVYYEETDRASVPCGAVIVAEGAGDIAVRLRLTRAVSALLGIDDSRIEVFEREGGNPHE